MKEQRNAQETESTFLEDEKLDYHKKQKICLRN